MKTLKLLKILVINSKHEKLIFTSIKILFIHVYCTWLYIILY